MASAVQTTGQPLVPAGERVRIGAYSFGPGALLRIALVATALVYVQTITYGFVYDDLLQIEMNPWTQSWKFWHLFFTTNVWSFLRANSQGSYYRPAFLLWVTANFSLFNFTPGWWHLTSVAAHIIATALVYAFAVRLLRDRWTAALAAIIFGVYPLHIEAVTWVSGVPEVLVTIFLLGALLSLQNWIERRQVIWMFVSVVLYALALLSKETALALLPVATVLVWRRGKEVTGNVRAVGVRLLPFLIVTAVYFAARQFAIGGISASTFPRPTAWVVLTWPAALWFYLRQLCWPFGLSILYDFDLVRNFSVSSVLIPAALSAATLAAISWFSRKLGLAVLALTWILAPLAPALIGIKVFQWHDYVHDRYLYLPSVMAAILVAAAIGRIATSLHAIKVAAVVAILLILSFATGTVLQNPQWANDLTLFDRARDRAPHNPLALDGHARVVYGDGRKEEGFAEFQRLLELDPNYWQGNVVLGLAFYQSGRYPEAEKYLTIATRVWPREFVRPDATQFYYLGLIQQRRHALDEAEKSLRRAVEIRPDAPGYRMALSQVLRARGDVAGAEEQMRLDTENRRAFAARQQGIGVTN